MRASAFSCALAILASLASCGKKQPEEVGVVVGPPLTIATSAASSFPETDAGAPPPSHTSPVTATFIDLSESGTPLKVRTCEQILVTVVKGKASTSADTLAEGDFLFTQGEGALTVKGSGLALVAAVRTDPCTPRGANEPPPALTLRTVRGATAPELTWAGGKMHARLDLEKDLTGAYAGRISGTAPIPEHTHEGSWEIFCAVEAKGTFTLDGKPRRLGPRDVVMVPPSTKHAFIPDEGSNLAGIQFYWPRGPEQRFREFDAKERVKPAGPTEKVRRPLP